MNYCHTRLEAIGEAARSLLRHPLATVLVLGASGGVLCLLVLAVAFAGRFTALQAPAWARAEALVLVAGAEGQTDLSAVRAALRKIEPVESVEFVGRDIALGRLAQRKALAPIGLGELRPNPLPDAFVVRLAAGVDPDAAEAAVAQLRRVKDVDDVAYEPEAYRKARALVRLAGRVLLVLAGALAAAVILGARIAAAAWLSVDREQARVLSMLGADAAAVRRPYVYAGALRLLLAAAIAWWLAQAVVSWVAPDLDAVARAYGVALDPAAWPGWAAPAFCAGGALLGAVIASVETRLALRALAR